VCEVLLEFEAEKRKTKKKHFQVRVRWKEEKKSLLTSFFSSRIAQTQHHNEAKFSRSIFFFLFSLYTKKKA
jgi:hypothetical protein